MANSKTMPASDDVPVLLTLEEAAKIVRKSNAQMRWMRHNGTGPRSAKLSGRIVYRRQDVLNWIDAAFADEDTRAASA